MEIDGLGLDLRGNHEGVFDYGLYYHSSLHIVRIGDEVIVVLKWRTRGIASFRAEELVDEGEDFGDGFVVSIFRSKLVHPGLLISVIEIGPTGPLGICRPMLTYHELVTTQGFFRRGVWGCVGRCCVTMVNLECKSNR
ncbi:hypothetical protein OROMI_009820 [Orobanche minor]